MSIELLLHPITAAEVKRIIQHPPHAVGILGVAGAGKSALAAHLAQELLELDDIADHPAVRFISGSEGIEAVRTIKAFLSLKVPGRAAVRRIVIIEGADSLGVDAQNALLKTLEEPPADTVVILTATQRSHLLPTIISRIHAVRVLPLSKDQCHAVSEHNKEDLNKAYSLSGGNAGLFLGLLEESEQHELLAGVNLAKQFLGQSIYERLCSIDNLSKDKENLFLLIEGLEVCLHAALKVGKQQSLKKLHKKLDTTCQARGYLEHNVQSKLVLTNLATSL